MNKKLLVELVVIIVVAATVFPAVYFLSTQKEAPAPSPPKSVQPKNNAPIASFSPNVTKAFHGAVVGFDASSSRDPEGDPLNFSWDFGDGEKDAGIRASHVFVNDGSYTVTLNVSDGSAFNTTSRGIQIVNAPPAITAYLPQTASVGIFEGQMQNFSVNASSPDGDPLTYAWSVDNRTIAGSVPRYSYNADFDSAGNYRVRVTVSDGKADVWREWQLAVKNVNRPPVMTLVEPPENFSIAEGAQMMLRATAMDPDDDALTYVWVLDNNVKGNGTGDRAEMMYAPDFRANGTHLARVSFSDGPSQVSWSWSMLVKNTNRPPVITNFTPNATTTMYESVPTPFSVSAEDPDGDGLTYNWTLDGAEVGDPASPSYNFVTNYSSAGSYKLGVEASDGKLKVSTRWNITVLHLNRPPVAKATVDFKTRNTGQPATFSASESSDPDGDPITFFWDLGDGNDSTSAVVTHAYMKGGKFRANLTVTDICGTQSKTFVEVTVKPGLMEAWRMGPFTSLVDRMLVDDVDSDGKKEIVAAFDAGEDANAVMHGHLAIFDLATQSKEWESPDIGSITGLAVANLDGDAALEMVVGLQTARVGTIPTVQFSGKIIVYDGATHGTDWEGASGFGGITSVDLMDINGDAKKEIMVGYGISLVVDINTYLGVYDGGVAIFSSSYSLLWNTSGWGGAGVMAAAELDGDIYVELVLFSIKVMDLGGGGGWVNNVSVFEWRGGALVLQGAFNDNSGTALPSAFRTADVNGDGTKEILFGTSDGTSTLTGNVYAYTPSMSRLWKSPDIGGIQTLEVADVDPISANMEVLVGVGEADNDDLSGRMIVYSSTWAELWRTGDIGFVNSIAVSDMNNDGITEIALGAVYYRNFDGDSNGTLHIISAATKLELFNATGFHDFTSPILLIDADADGMPELLFADWLESGTVCNIWLYGM